LSSWGKKGRPLLSSKGVQKARGKRRDVWKNWDREAITWRAQKIGRNKGLDLIRKESEVRKEGQVWGKKLPVWGEGAGTTIGPWPEGEGEGGDFSYSWEAQRFKDGRPRGGKKKKQSRFRLEKTKREDDSSGRK